MYPSTLWIGLEVYSCGARPFWGLKFLILVRFVHLVDLCRLFDLSWVCPLCGHESWSLAGSVHLVGLCKFFTLVGFVHFVDMNFDFPWGPSTLWIYVGFLTLVGSVHFVDKNLNPPWGPSALWTYVSFDPCWVRPLCGQESWSSVGSVHLVDLCKFFYPCWVRPLCGQKSWSLVGSVHLVDLCRFFTLVESVHFMDKNLDPLWGPSTLWTYVEVLPI